MNNTDNTRPANNEKVPPGKVWIKPEIIILGIASGAVPGPEGAITGGGASVGEDS